MKKYFTQLLTLLMVLLLGVGVVAQPRQQGAITGSIKTSDGKPAANVSVGIKSTSKRTQTNEEGVFSLKGIASGSYVVKISAIGIAPQEKNVTVEGKNTAQVDFYIAESASQLEEVAVNGYRTPNEKPVKVGKVAIAPRDLPQSVQIIGEQVIADQQVNRLTDVMKNVNGVALGANRGSVGDNFYARGYSLGANNIFKNGARTTIGGFPEASTLESVEVLKGSAALLYGGVTGGAVVNMVTKKPKFEYGGEVSFRAGSYDLYKPSFDFYGPMSKDMAFRLVGTTETANSYRDNVHSKRLYINPSILYKISDKTDLLIQADYLKSDFTPDFGIGTVGNAISPLSRNAFLNTAFAYNRTNTTTAQANLNHKFNQDWNLNVLVALQNYSRDYFSTERPAAEANGNWNRALTRSRTNEFTYNEQINLTGKINTFGLKHTLIVGLDADQSRITTGAFTNPNLLGPANARYFDNVNLLNPSSFNKLSNIAMPETALLTNTLAPVYRMGGFVQDLIAISEQFKVLAGVRWTFQKTPTTDVTTVATGVKTKGTAVDKIDKAYSPKFGLIYQPLKNTSLYISYANNFIANTGTDVNLNALKPSLVDQYEAGVKNDFFDGKLSANVTVYRINNNNFAQMALLKADGSANSDANIKEFTGKTSSDGLEVDITATLVKGLNLIAGYSYNYMRYTETLGITDLYNNAGVKIGQTSGLLTDVRLVGTTKNTANATLFYTVQDGALKGFKLGASGFYTGDRNGGRDQNKLGTSTGLIPIKGFTTYDVSAGYTIGKVSLLAKLSNITNELNYYVHENYSVNPTPPRQVMGTLTYKF